MHESKAYGELQTGATTLAFVTKDVAASCEKAVAAGA